MAVNLPNKYPGRFDPVSADYPQGKFKNRSSPTAEDGSYMERDWLNDWAGFFGAMLSGAGITPNNVVDTAQSSQFFTALQAVILKSLPKRSFASSDFIRIPDVPGGLIIQWGSFTITSTTVGVLATTNVTLGTSNPNALLRVMITPNNSDGAAVSYSVNASKSNPNQFIGQMILQATGTRTLEYVAIGY